LAPFFSAYYSLVSFADSQIKTKTKNTNILAPKFVIFLFVYIFSVFFPPKTKFRQKRAKKATAEN
jgi:hypothetical protein